MSAHTILLVEDDENVRDVLFRTLKKEGYEVLLAQSGREGKSVMDTEGAGLIITDIIMPDGDGLEFIRELLATNKTVPVIAISGGGMIAAEDYLKIARLSGVRETFRKPFEIQELLAAVKRLLPLPA
ncbi:MAG TPA: response regulator [Candidatus Limnocylindria bacterium]|jgi:DNA-binding response OmpR family regulator|nr:response regulator [Candidatus Limnocylindria bacterium]